jgi:signal transduction histidine kinase
MVAALLWISLLAVAAVAWALQGPWLGLSLTAQGEALVVAGVRGPAAAAGMPRGAVLRAIEGGTSGRGGAQDSGSTAAESRMALRADDITEEPDMVERYATLDAFFARQGQITAILRAPSVTVEWTSAHATTDGPPQRTTLQPTERPVSSLPLRFWFQLAVASLACLVACWVWSLRPRDAGAAMFGLTGLLLPLSALAAGVYGARELALPQVHFALLSAINHGSSALWGAAFVGIFMAHPRPLFMPAHLVLPFALFGTWWLVGQLRLVDGLDAGIRLLLVAELLAAIALAVWQWRLSRRQPLERAALRWFLLSLLLGSSLFIASIIVTVVLGWLPPLPQGYAFGFFLLIYAGIAVGLRRHRLFELDAWAWRLLAWAGGVIAVLTLDALLILLLDWSQGAALGVSLWLGGLLYFPARQLLWSRLVQQPRRQLSELMPDIVGSAFQPAAGGREARWDALLRELHDPLTCTVAAAAPGAPVAPGTPAGGSSERPTAPHPGSETGDARKATRAPVRIAEEGLALQVPPCAGMPGRILRHAAAGRRLFTQADASFMDAVCALMDEAAAGRDAQERGAAAERRRIAQDMHDDVGARLLMLIHRAPNADLAELARTAMADLRAALSALDAQATPLADALADWRAEATQRCEAAGVRLDWQGPTHEFPTDVPPLSARQRLLVERALREGLTNALKHGRPRQVAVAVELHGEALTLQIQDDGGPSTTDAGHAVQDPAQWVEGRGLRGMRQRLREFNGTLTVGRGARGHTELQVTLPLRTNAPGA